MGAAPNRPGRERRAPSGLPSLLRTSPVSVVTKFILALAAALSWSAFSLWAAQYWFEELAGIAGWPVAMFVIAF